MLLLSLASELRKEIADTMLSNLETDKKMFRSLATEVCTFPVPHSPSLSAFLSCATSSPGF
jgi:hypothetical protein